MAIHHIPGDAGPPAMPLVVPIAQQICITSAVLAVRELTVLRRQHRPAVDRLSLEVARGEILGIAAIEGQGQAELAAVLTGQRLPAHGALMLEGLPLALGDGKSIRQQGLVRMALQRHCDMKQPARSVADRGMLAANEPRQGRAGNHGDQANLTLVHTGTAPRCMVAEQPTRGIDVATAQQLHRRLLALRAAGAAVLLISADVDELLALSDRLAVLFDGRLVAHFAAHAVSARTLSLALIGALGRGPVAATLDAPFTPGLPPHREPG